MSEKGVINSWKGDRGFGFIRPDDGSDDVFLHITALNNRQRRPRRGDEVRYTVSEDENGRIRAANVSFADESALSVSQLSGNAKALAVALLFLGGVAASAFVGGIPFIVFYLYLGMSILSFIVFASDKWSAQKQGARIAERTLLVFSLFGGWPGALVAQQKLRHKTRKTSFQMMFWLVVVINCAALVWWHTEAGQQQLNMFLGRL